jgi:hypothetical protein
MAAKIEAVRPQRDAADRPLAVLLALVLAHALVDQAVLERLELHLEMSWRRIVAAVGALPFAPVVVHPFEVHRVAGVLLALKPVARHVDKLNRATIATFELPDVLQRLSNDEIESKPMTPDEVTAFFGRETAHWAPAAKAAAASGAK